VIFWRVFSPSEKGKRQHERERDSKRRRLNRKVYDMKKK
jgi:hypothetical protein